MTIEVLEQKYRCGCGKGLAILTKPELITKLNSIIDWEKSKFPKKINPNYSNEEIKSFKDEVRKLEEELCNYVDTKGDEFLNILKKINELNDKYIIEDRDFLGSIPELKPGNVFQIKPGQIVAVEDENSLVLIISETGAGALDRIWEEEVSPEILMYFNGSSSIESLNWEKISEDNIEKDFDKEFRPGYKLYKSWKDSFLKKESLPEKGFTIEVTMDSDNFVFPLDFIMKDWSILYKSSQLDEDMVGSAVSELLEWFYNN